MWSESLFPGFADDQGLLFPNGNPLGLGELQKILLHWRFPEIGVPQNGWFIREHSIKMDDDVIRNSSTLVFENS